MSPPRSRRRRLGFLLAAGALLLLVSGCRSERRGAEEFVATWKTRFNSHDVPGIASMYANDGAYSLPGMVYFVRSPAELRDELDKLWRTTPDMRITAVPQMIAGDGSIAFVWEMTRTPNAAQQPQTIYGATFMNLENGRIRQQLTMTAR